MLTIFTIPKPFQGHIEIIQRNAIESWLRLRPNCEVVLCGNDRGVAEAASEYGVQHIPDIAVNEYRTPLISSAFERAQLTAQHHLVCYVNADIIFLSDLLNCVERIKLARFLIVGQRWDLNVNSRIRFEEEAWEQELRERICTEGRLHGPGGSDYFVFPKETIGKLPDFAVGRPGWDNWLIYRARSLKMPVIDTSKANTVIHQNHGYSHVQKTAHERLWHGPEAERNKDLAGGDVHMFGLLDATHIMTSKAVVPALGYWHVRRRLLRYWQRLRSRILVPFLTQDS